MRDFTEPATIVHGISAGAHTPEAHHASPGHKQASRAGKDPRKEVRGGGKSERALLYNIQQGRTNQIASTSVVSPTISSSASMLSTLLRTTESPTVHKEREEIAHQRGG